MKELTKSQREDQMMNHNDEVYESTMRNSIYVTHRSNGEILEVIPYDDDPIWGMDDEEWELLDELEDGLFIQLMTGEENR
jgi:hypothetical protein